MIVSSIVFAATALLLIFGLTFLVSAIAVPATEGEKRFEKRLEYSVLGGGALVAWLVLFLMA
ncbi:hypothetical protein QE250_10245 [Chromatiaceae bacterium AAb-1]|nr:hypothetical protein [Chromatiaceae bacterium AAb-1]